MKLLNLGCGKSYHPLWTNIDFVSTGPDVLAHNLLSGIPFSDHSFDAVYHSHVLEHFSKGEAQSFIAECYRVLKPAGVLRVIVPDLEGIVKCYLTKLDECLVNKPGANDDYDWILLELLDQMVRKSSGGEMRRYLLEEKNKDFVFNRIGNEAKAFWTCKDGPLSKMDKIKRMSLIKILQTLGLKLVKNIFSLLGCKRFLKVYEEGLFRNSGEPHQWMYDRYSLKRLLEEAGFVNVKVCAANESRIPEFWKYSLDVLDGVVRKPDSLFVEASKP